MGLKYLPRTLSQSARNIVDIGSTLLQLESHDQVSGKINSSLGMVAESDWTGVGEDFRDGATDELEWVVLVASCWKKVTLKMCLPYLFLTPKPDSYATYLRTIST